MAEEEDRVASSTSLEQSPRNCVSIPIPTGSDTVLSTQWLQQIQEMCRVMRTLESYVYYPLQLQVARFTLASTGTIPPGVVYSDTLQPCTSSHSAVLQGAVQPGATPQPSTFLPGTTNRAFLPTDPFSYDTVLPVVSQTPTCSSTQLLSHGQPKTPNRIKGETSIQDLRPSHEGLLDAELRLHLSEMHRRHNQQDFYNKHTTWGASLHVPKPSTALRISKEVQPTQDATSATESNSKKMRATLVEQGVETGGFPLESNLRKTCASLKDPNLKSHDESCKGLPGYESDREISPSVLDVNPKTVRTTPEAIAEVTYNSPANTHLHKSVIKSPVTHQGSQWFSEECTPHQESLHFLPSSKHLKHSSSPYFRQESCTTTTTFSSGLQNDRLGHQLQSPKRKLTAERMEKSHTPTSEATCAVPAGTAAPECVPSTVSEVGCLKPEVPALVSLESLPFEALQSPQSRHFVECKNVTVAPSKADSFLHRQLALPHSDNSTELPHSKPSENSPKSKKTELTLQNRHGQVEECETSVGAKVNYQERPPPDNKCPICGDKVSGYHYGMYSCESCKGFFKRTIQSKRHEKLQCEHGGCCVVTLRNRKHCAACRFQKCLSLGMKLEAIREDRQRGGRSLYQGSSEQRRLAKLKEQAEVMGSAPPKKRKPRQPSDPQTTSRGNSDGASGTSGWVSSSMPHGKEEARQSQPAAKPRPPGPAALPPLIQDLVAQEEVFTRQSVAECCLSTLRQEKNLLETICHFVNHQMLPLVRWARGLPLYSQLTIEDQIHLLHKGGLSVLCLNLIFYCLDGARRLLLPQNQVIDLSTFNEAKFNQLVPKITTIGHQLHHLGGLDLHRFVCLKLMVLLNSDAALLQDNERVQSYQQTIQDTFFAHVTHKQPQNSRAVGNLMLGLAAIERVAQQLGQQTVYDKDVVDHMFRHDTSPERPWIRTGV